MGNFFGIRRRPTTQAVIVTPQDHAVLQLKQRRDTIKIYQKRIESKLEEEKELAKKLLQANMKDRALVILRKKKFMEESLKRTDAQLATLEQLVQDVEFSQIQVSVVEALKVGSAALTQLNKMMSIDDIQLILENNQEAAEKQKQILDLLGDSDRYEESELMGELEEYDKISLKLPDVPEEKIGEDKQEKKIERHRIKAKVEE